MGPAWVFDYSCKPYERPLVILARVWSVDAAGASHEMARVEDTNYDGVPSAGDALVLGEYPYFTSYNGPVAYGHFTVTTHLVTWAYPYTTSMTRGLSVFSDVGSWAFAVWDLTAPDNTLGYEDTYTEYPSDNANLQTFFIDAAGSNVYDTTRVTSASPGHPDRDLWEVGTSERNLFDIEFDFAF